MPEKLNSKEWEQRVEDKFPTLKECKKAATDYADKKSGNEYFLSEYGRTFKAHQEGINWALNYVKNKLPTDWEQLREKFFRDMCYTSSPSGLMIFNPYQVFEWFKNNLTK